jgi:hypothetical protein
MPGPMNTPDPTPPRPSQAATYLRGLAGMVLMACGTALAFHMLDSFTTAPAWSLGLEGAGAIAVFCAGFALFVQGMKGFLAASSEGEE